LDPEGPLAKAANERKRNIFHAGTMGSWKQERVGKRRYGSGGFSVLYLRRKKRRNRRNGRHGSGGRQGERSWDTNQREPAAAPSEKGMGAPNPEKKQQAVSKNPKVFRDESAEKGGSAFWEQEKETGGKTRRDQETGESAS